MADLRTLSANKSLSLEDLQVTVGQNEQTLGPLTQLGHNANKTLLTFDMDQDPPTIVAILAFSQNDPPAGAAHICNGTCFVGSELKKLSAYRPG